MVFREESLKGRLLNWLSFMGSLFCIVVELQGSLIGESRYE